MSLIEALLDVRPQAARVAREVQSIYSALIENAEDTIILSALDGAQNARAKCPVIARILASI